MKVIWSELAIERTTEIAKYMAQENPAAAERWVEAFFDRVKQLADFPKSGRRVPEINRPNVREIFFQNYRLIYKIEAEWVIILTVRHDRQLLRADDTDNYCVLMILKNKRYFTHPVPYW